MAAAKTTPAQEESSLQMCELPPFAFYSIWVPNLLDCANPHWQVFPPRLLTHMLIVSGNTLMYTPEVCCTSFPGISHVNNQD
jgi:hypothetical protein